MSLFDQNTPREDSEILLYQAIKEELKPILEELDKKLGTIKNSDSVSFTIMDPSRMMAIKETSKVVMQFIWKKLGMKIPDYSRRVLDDNYKLLEVKKGEYAD